MASAGLNANNIYFDPDRYYTSTSSLFGRLVD